MTSIRAGIQDLAARLRRMGNGFWWGVAAVFVAFLPVAGALSTSRVFFLRDLSFYFWPEHLWVREAWLSGRFPLWDPYVGCGQAALSDPIRHLLYPPVALLRFVPSAELGFNLAVALPFPLAALGMYLFLARMVRPRAAALGAVAFAASGPMLSTGNILNFSWAAATIPWILLAVEMQAESPTRRRFAMLAVGYAMLLLAGEGPMLVGTAVLSVAYALARSGPRGRIRAGGRVVVAGLTGLALSGVLAVPFFLASVNSPRAGGADARVATFWSLHPLTLLESVSFAAFGDSTGDRGWQLALNGGYEPFVYSVYFGIAVLAIAVVGMLNRRRRWDGRFWISAFIGTLLMALGRFTPVYGVLRAIFPALDAVRFPSKFVVLTAVTVAILTAFGWDSLDRADAVTTESVSPRSRRLVVSLLGVVGLSAMVVAVVVLLGSTSDAGDWLARAVGMSNPSAARRFLDESLQVAAPRLALLAVALAVALVFAGRTASRYRALGLQVIVLIAVADPVLTGWALNPLGESRYFGEPRWARLVREDGARVYVGGRLRFTVDRTPDPDDAEFALGVPLTTNSPLESSAAYSLYTATFPSAFGIRDSVSFDNAMLWSREYWLMREQLRQSSFDNRRRLLDKAAVGFYLVPWTDVAGATVVDVDPRFSPLALWKVDEPPSRAEIVTNWTIEPNSRRAIDPGSDAPGVVVVDRETDPAGSPGVPVEALATIVIDETDRVSIDAAVPEGGGMLVLRDTDAPGWRVTVDGTPSTIVRADGLFRGVRLSSGSHRVEFAYEPPGFRFGIGMTCITALGLAWFVLAGRRPER